MRVFKTPKAINTYMIIYPTMIEKAIRSLVAQGQSESLTLTLPKEWTDKHRLGKGQYVKLEEDGDALVVLPWKEDE
jgi:hypothetical protein